MVSLFASVSLLFIEYIVGWEVSFYEEWNL